MTSGQLRLVKLSILAKVRIVGWLPWVLLMLWGVIAGVGEPLVLRAFGISLQEQATWVGAAFVATVLLLAAGDPSRLGSRVATNLGLVAMVVAVQCTQVVVLEAAFGYAVSLTDSCRRGLHFAVSWFPVVAALSVAKTPQTVYQYILIASCLMTSLTVAVRTWDSIGDPVCLLALAMSATACVFAVARSAPVVMIKNRP